MSMPGQEPTSASLVGQLVSGRYRIEKMLGEGGMGAVYLAEHTHMRKRVALKLLHAEMSQEPEILARFRREAEAAAHVEHPNVAAATDFGQTEDGSFFLVLEYVEGTSLRDVFRDGPLAPARALHVGRQIALALERAHASGIVHRDLKPENVMLVRKGADPDFVKVLDFGIAKVEPHPTLDSAQPLTRAGTILGTPEYMAPEQALGDAVGPGADLYALGVMLYEMLTGKHPFDADDRMAVLSMHIVAPVPPMGDRNPNVTVPPAIEELVRRLLEKEAAQRPAGARALIEEMREAATRSNIELLEAGSLRAAGGESTPDLGRTSSVSAPSAPLSVSAGWRDGDALAKTFLPGTPALSGLERPKAGASLLDRVKGLPRPVLLAVVGVGSLLVGAVLVALIFSRGSDASLGTYGDAGPAQMATSHASSKASHASADKLHAASASGSAALEALASSYPDDPAVAAELVKSYAGNGRMSDALRATRTLAKLDPGAVDDTVFAVVIAAAQRSDTSEEAFALLEGPLGARGVDGLVELSSTKTVPLTIQRRATKSLARPEVRANASPATGVLLSLKAAKTCTDRRELLDAIKESADARVLPTLKAMKQPRGCGFLGMRDCWACMRKDDSLEDTIKAVEARSPP
jgi:serine/threonine-protein kinase